MEPLEQREWASQVPPERWLTIGDVYGLSSGDELDLLSFNQNAYNTTDWTKPWRPYQPADFFAYNRVTYIHDNGLRGTLDIQIYSPWKPIERRLPFEFHLEARPGRWSPLISGVLPEEGAAADKWDFPSGRLLSEFSNRTRVGWEGPLLKMNNLDGLPKVFRAPPESIQD